MGVPKPGIYIGTRLYTEPGYLILEEDGQKSQLPIADMLRAADIPALTYAQVGAIKVFANLFFVAIRSLIEKGLLDEGVLEDGGYDLPAIIQTLEDMGGNFGEPDLTVD